MINNKDNNIKKNSFNDLKIFINERFKYDDNITVIHDRWIKFRNRTKKSISGDVNIRVGAWNLQSLSKDINQRYKKIEFIRETLNCNKFDILWLMDVNETNALILNNYKKYTDGRNILFVKDEFIDTFNISMNCIYSEILKLAFIYITPQNKDKILLNNINILIKKNFTVIGDFNIKSNRNFADNNIYHFTGEDSLQIGAIAKKYIRTVSIAAPSDHRFVIFNFRNFANLAYALKIGEFSYLHSRKCVFNILNGIKPKYFPKIKRKQYRMGLNDRELSINAMIDDYLNNDIRKLFKKYNFLWKFDRREPFLGKEVPLSVQSSYATHLKEDFNKNYETVPNVKVTKSWSINLSVQKTNSMAINHEFISLSNITKAINEFILNPDNREKDIANNVIKIANEMREDLNAEVFFLQKNKVIKDFNDVRVIVIIPTIIKIYESLIFSRVMGYLSKVIKKKNYQFGGVLGGSTYKAMLKIKKLNNKGITKGLVLFDMSKGYDTVNLEILEKTLEKIRNEEVRSLCMSWAKMIKNMDVMVNNKKIKRTRGIPMGLSLSPIIFVYYVDNALAEIDKTYLSMYLDDLAIVFPENKSTFLCVALVDRIIQDLAKFDLIINVKKTGFMSENQEIINQLSPKFKRIDSSKYLGRLVSLNGDGKIVPDDRYYNLKAFRASACCYWATFFTKRIVFNSALDAKLRFRLLMWASNSAQIRKAIWVNNWSFFRKCMGSYSYLQLSFAIFNIFRYFLDITDIMKWKNEINSNNQDIIEKNVIDSLLTGIDKIDNAIKLIKPDFDIMDYNDDGEIDEFEFTKEFCEDLWIQFKKALLKNYKHEKRNIKFQYYENIDEFCFSKLFNYFGILQQVAFIHFRRNIKRGRSKEIFILTALNALYQSLNKTVIYSFYNLDEEAQLIDLNINNFQEDLKEIYNEDDINSLSIADFEEFMIKEFRKLWPLLDLIINVFNDSKRKGEADIDKIEEELNKFEYKAFVDGSAILKKVGWAATIYKKDNTCLSKQKGKLKKNKYTKKLRNVAGELGGTLEVIKKAISLNIKKMVLVFDYYGIQKYADGSWIPQDPFTKEYVLQFRELTKKIDITFYKIASHTGLPGNEEVDQLAKAAIGLKGGEFEGFNNNGPMYPQKNIDYLKKNFKVIFKILTIIEMIYLNNNLNQLTVGELLMNLIIKFNNLDEFTNKCYNIAMMEDNLDPIDDQFVDIINDLI